MFSEFLDSLTHNLSSCATRQDVARLNRSTLQLDPFEMPYHPCSLASEKAPYLFETREEFLRFAANFPTASRNEQLKYLSDYYFVVISKSSVARVQNAVLQFNAQLHSGQFKPEEVRHVINLLKPLNFNEASGCLRALKDCRLALYQTTNAVGQQILLEFRRFAMLAAQTFFKSYQDAAKKMNDISSEYSVVFNASVPLGQRFSNPHFIATQNNISKAKRIMHMPIDVVSASGPNCVPSMLLGIEESLENNLLEQPYAVDVITRAQIEIEKVREDFSLWLDNIRAA